MTSFFYALKISIAPSSPMRTICDGSPALSAMSDDRYASAHEIICSSTTANDVGDGCPLRFADVDTIGFPYATSIS